MPLNIRGSNCRASFCTLSKNEKLVCASARPGCQRYLHRLSAKTLRNCITGGVKEELRNLQPSCQTSVTALRQLSRQQALAR